MTKQTKTEKRLDAFIANDATLADRRKTENHAMVIRMLDFIQDRIDRGAVLGMEMATRVEQEFPHATREQIVRCLELRGYHLAEAPERAHRNARRDDPLVYANIKGTWYRFERQPKTPEQNEVDRERNKARENIYRTVNMHRPSPAKEPA